MDGLTQPWMVTTMDGLTQPSTVSKADFVWPLRMDTNDGETNNTNCVRTCMGVCVCKRWEGRETGAGSTRHGVPSHLHSGWDCMGEDRQEGCAMRISRVLGYWLHR